ncbi:hypothetical protein D3C76_1288800 [compost metagenome]
MGDEAALAFAVQAVDLAVEVEHRQRLPVPGDGFSSGQILALAGDQVAGLGVALQQAAEDTQVLFNGGKAVFGRWRAGVLQQVSADAVGLQGRAQGYAVAVAKGAGKTADQQVVTLGIDDLGCRVAA